MPDPFPNELVEAAAKALAGEPRCYCPDDWRADPSPRCPFHGDGEWPTYAHYLQARAVLSTVAPLIQQAERDRLAKQAGTNPYIDGDGIPTWAAWEAWDEGAACGVAAERERRTDDLEAAWGLIANAWNGNWNDAPVEWLDAAARFRDDRWHPLLDAALSSPVEPDTEASNE